jgi:hypothetical protein
MPWYRTDDGQSVYNACIRSKTGPPLACRAPRFEGDDAAHGEQCGRIGGKLCDAPRESGPSAGRWGTCDMPLCSKHATHVDGKDLDYCPRHAHLAHLAVT